MTIAHTRFAGTVVWGALHAWKGGMHFNTRVKGDRHIHEPDGGPHLSEGEKKVTLHEGGTQSTFTKKGGINGILRTNVRVKSCLNVLNYVQKQCCELPCGSGVDLNAYHSLYSPHCCCLRAGKLGLRLLWCGLNLARYSCSSVSC
jgi:hypothetical protein